MERHVINENASLLDALRQLNALSGTVMTLIAIDNNGIVTGTLTDGDVRRALLRGVALDACVKTAMHHDFKYLKGDIVDVEMMRNFRLNGITLLPHIDNDGKIKRIYDLTIVKTVLPISAILMAGGKGERLLPLTANTPKPLLKICDKAIIDYNIEALALVGIDNITVTTHYLAAQIHEHFSKPVANVQVKCVEEPSPLGTLGAVSLVEKSIGDATIVMNSDLLTTISYEDMYIRHMEEKADITVAVIPYVVSVPFAILDTDGVCVKNIEEKPTHSYYANAGIYIFSNEILNTLAYGEKIDAPDFVQRAIDNGKRVVYFPINGTWIDIGTPNDFKQAQELMQHYSNLTR